jgi:hypothetical protein
VYLEKPLLNDMLKPEYINIETLKGLMVQQAWKLPLKHLHALVYKLTLCDSEYIESHKYVSDSSIPSFRTANRVMGMVSKVNPKFLKNVLSLITMEILVENRDTIFMRNKTEAEYRKSIECHVRRPSNEEKLRYVYHILHLESHQQISFDPNFIRQKSSLEKQMKLIPSIQPSVEVYDKILYVYRKETELKIQKCTMQSLILYDTLVKLEDQKILFFN